MSTHHMPFLNAIFWKTKHFFAAVILSISQDLMNFSILVYIKTRYSIAGFKDKKHLYENELFFCKNRKLLSSYLGQQNKFTKTFIPLI